MSEHVAALRNYAPAVVVLGATAWWLIEVTRWWAGWDAPAVTVGAPLIALAVIAVRPDRVLPPRILALAVTLSTAAFVVPLTAPTGWDGATVAASYVCVAWLVLVVAATTVRYPGTRLWFITLIVISAPVEFVSGWISWWGGEDPSAPMVGTFYWHNPFAAFLMPGGLLGLALWIWRDRLIALLGLVAFVFASMGIVYATSRAGLATFVLGVVVLGLMAVVNDDRLRSLRQLAIAAVLGAAATYAIGGPPFFDERSSPLAGEHARTASQSLGQNSGYRLDFWREALTVFRHHPVTGGGYKSLVAESAGRVPSDWPMSPYAHNGYLQALGEGGLVLAIPFLLGVLAVAYLLLRFLLGRLRSREPSMSRYAVPVALGCVLLHSGVDFDWVYPASFAMAAVLAGLVVGRWLTDGTPAPSTSRPMWLRLGLAGSFLAAIGLLGLSAWVARDGNHRANLPTRNSAL